MDRIWRGGRFSLQFFLNPGKSNKIHIRLLFELVLVFLFVPAVKRFGTYLALGIFFPFLLVPSHILRLEN